MLDTTCATDDPDGACANANHPDPPERTPGYTDHGIHYHPDGHGGYIPDREFLA
jgi:hypothetical protein